MLVTNIKPVTRYKLRKLFATRKYATNEGAPHVLEPLPYPKNSLFRHLSEETIEYHYNKHHATYVEKLNELVKGTKLADMTLMELLKTQKGPVYNNAAQNWNNNFYWNSMSPNGGGQPTGGIANLIDCSFGSFEEFKKQFFSKAVSHFGSGWIWLVLDTSGSLKIVDTHNAHNPILDKMNPLLTLDVWEHAYYIDYRNDRAKFVDSWWNMVNWKFADRNLSKYSP